MFTIRKSWRPNVNHKPPQFPKTFGPVIAENTVPTRFFDQLSAIGDEFVQCFVLETTEGLILIDCLYPYPKYVDMIESGLQTLGLNPANLKAILITHGHFDHFGQADYFRDTYGTRIYMSKKDYEFARAIDGRRGGLMQIPYEVTDFLDEGDVFSLGDTHIHVAATPGHSPGGLSFVFNVTDEGRPHMACLWGGTGVPRTLEEQQQYLASVQHFTDFCDKLETDVEISNHPTVDNGLLRLQMCREISNGVANPFVIGRAACHRYTEMFAALCRERMANTEPLHSRKIEDKDR